MTTTLGYPSVFVSLCSACLFARRLRLFSRHPRRPRSSRIESSSSARSTPASRADRQHPGPALKGRDRRSWLERPRLAALHLVSDGSHGRGWRCTTRAGPGRNVLSDVQVHVYKPSAKLKTLAAAKITRKKMSGCDAYPLIKEEADYLVFDCKMRSMHTLQFLMLRDIGGVTYVCESEGHAETVADLDDEFAAVAP